MEIIHNKIKLCDSDLRKQQYPIEVLIENVDYLSIKTLLHWQKLDADFCKKYILNEEYQCVEEKYMVKIEYVLKRQHHLSYEELI